MNQQTNENRPSFGLMKLNDVSMSSAASVFQSILGFVLVLLSNMLVRKVDPDSSLF